MKWLDSDVDAFEVIFKVEDMNEHEKNPNRILWNPFRETFTNIKELEKDMESYVSTEYISGYRAHKWSTKGGFYNYSSQGLAFINRFNEFIKTFY